MKKNPKRMEQGLICSLQPFIILVAIICLSRQFKRKIFEIFRGKQIFHHINKLILGRHFN